MLPAPPATPFTHLQDELQNLVSDERIELSLLRPKRRVIPFHQSEIKTLVDHWGIEPQYLTCKASVIPLYEQPKINLTSFI